MNSDFTYVNIMKSSFANDNTLPKDLSNQCYFAINYSCIRSIHLLNDRSYVKLAVLYQAGKYM